MNGMDAVRQFARGIVNSVPDIAKLFDTRGELIIPKSLQTPAHKRAGQDMPEPRHLFAKRAQSTGRGKV